MFSLRLTFVVRLSDKILFFRESLLGEKTKGRPTGIREIQAFRDNLQPKTDSPDY
ncbi:hypothetical protein LPTSP3_g03190 [Leptospira kobayashii]|uniref:Uncharacterized protein n=1 Tax=Leptospira kobayashii TaxID=1917830 RepID=A0ABM7UFN7_9LEPT|nr:hypothetical protein LPTSP3_g03190 [Leptospira kobayashii]